MLTGGIENALINFIKVLPKDEYSIDVYLVSKSGGFVDKAEAVCDLKEIPMPDKIRRSIPRGGIRVASKTLLQEKRYIEAYRMIVKCLLGNRKFTELNVKFDKIPSMQEKFDIAVCYQMHSPFLVKYVAEKVDADKKVAWMHNDFATTNYDIRALKSYMDQYDCYFGNAVQIVEEFTTIFPEYRNNTKVIHSVLDWENMVNLSQHGEADEFLKDGKTLNILTIARLENQKAIDWAVEACSILKKEQIEGFKWFIIGDGSEREKIEKMIRENEIQDIFCLLGSRTNPYPYYANCDIYVQTSRHEGYATTITEASMFKKPIVTTNVSGVSEQLINGVTGIVTDFTPNDIAEGIKKALDRETREKIVDALSEINIGAEDAVGIFESMLNR